MQRLYQRLKGKGLEVVAVNLQEDEKTVEKFVDEYKLTFPILLDRSGRAGSTYGARSIPTTYIIDSQWLTSLAGTRIGTRGVGQRGVRPVLSSGCFSSARMAVGPPSRACGTGHRVPTDRFPAEAGGDASDDQIGRPGRRAASATTRIGRNVTTPAICTTIRATKGRTTIPAVCWASL